MLAHFRTVCLTAVLSLIESIQILIIAVTIFHFIPLHPSPYLKDVFPVVARTATPEREIFFFHVFVAAGILIFAGGLWLMQREASREDRQELLRRLIMSGGFWLLVQLFAVFKIVMYRGQLPWAYGLFYTALVLAVASRIFWIEIDAFFFQMPARMARWAKQRRVHALADVLVLLVVLLGLWIFDLDRLWSAVNAGGGLAQAQKLWAGISPLFQWADYQQALPWLLIANLLYIAVFYFFLRWLTGQVLVPVCGLLLAVKWQFFHLGLAPVVWQFPDKTFLPFLPDIFLWLCLLAHARRPYGQMWPAAASVICGFYMAYDLPAGIWAWGALSVYMRLKRLQAAWTFIPVCVFVGWGTMFYGWDGFTGLLQGQWASLAAALKGPSLPYYDCLRTRHFFEFTAQFLVPVLYFAAFAAAEDPLIKAVCAYGLGIFTVHAAHASLGNFYSVSSPLVIVLCFWAARLSWALPPQRRTVVLLLLALCFAGGLYTNIIFGMYPNVWNMNGIHWPQAH